MKKPWLMIVLALFGASCFTLAVSSSESSRVSSTPPENSPDPTSYAMYLANAGVLVAHGETKIAFDPIFRVSFGSYLLMSEELERSLFAGEPPFDGLDAVFISHNHGDHFSAADILRFMTTHQSLELFAPEQAVEGIRAIHRTLDVPAASDPPYYVVRPKVPDEHFGKSKSGAVFGQLDPS
jgi:glyoxylase-like metal-dependent hydrolase (beta-lactamase superfamily II)